MISTPLLALSYALLAALVLNIWIATKWSTAFKISLVLIMTLLYIGTYLGLREIQGWPTTDPMPDSFRLLWAKIDEPDKQSGSEGNIYMWVQNIDAAERLTGEPRAYKLPYRLDLAEKVQSAMNKSEEGAILNGKMTRGMIKEQKEELKAEEQIAEGDSDPTGPADGRILLEFTEVPRTQLPAKGI